MRRSLLYKCSCGSINISVFDAKDKPTLACPICGKAVQSSNIEREFTVKGYWRGKCPFCGVRIGTDIHHLGGEEYGFCGACFRMFKLVEGKECEEERRDST